MKTGSVILMRSKNRGVTLIELIIVIVIVGILAAIAIPGYRAYIIRANRSDAKAALLATAGALERCFTRFNSYAAADGCAVAFPANSTENHYVVTAPVQTAVAFSLSAAPQGGQAGDTGCGNFTLNSTNARNVSGTKPWRECWGR
jgi:type IV pilus assembly protein PilE